MQSVVAHGWIANCISTSLASSPKWSKHPGFGNALFAHDSLCMPLLLCSFSSFSTQLFSLLQIFFFVQYLLLFCLAHCFALLRLSILACCSHLFCTVYIYTFIFSHLISMQYPANRNAQGIARASKNAI